MSSKAEKAKEERRKKIESAKQSRDTPSAGSVDNSVESTEKSTTPENSDEQLAPDSTLEGQNENTPTVNQPSVSFEL
jgi:hypothetical protein